LTAPPATANFRTSNEPGTSRTQVPSNRYASFQPGLDHPHAELRVDFHFPAASGLTPLLACRTVDPSKSNWWTKPDSAVFPGIKIAETITGSSLTPLSPFLHHAAKGNGTDNRGTGCGPENQICCGSATTTDACSPDSRATIPFTDS